MKKIKYWTIKIFFVTLIISAGVSVMAEYFIGELSLGAAVAALAVLIIVGIVFDVIGVAFASCDQAPFIAMSAKKNKKAHHALKLLKNADVVANFCNDVVGDICGIVSGAAGASITLKALVFMRAEGPSFREMALSIIVSALIAACTVAGKAWGKNVAMKKNREIVLAIGSAVNFFSLDRSRKKDRNDEKED